MAAGQRGAGRKSMQGVAMSGEWMGGVVRLLTFIKFSHTVFALPFALGAMLVAAGGLPGARVFGLILLAMVSARTCAMTFNRLADWEIDKLNPRTAGRHTLIRKPVAVVLFAVSAAVFVLSAWGLNPLCFALSPVALAIICFYSLTKRFTAASHFFLGLALGVSPVGAWMAVTGVLAWEPVVLAMAVLFWVAGFDLIYALQDREFDIKAGLHSLAARLSPPAVLRVARLLHLLAVAGLLGFGLAVGAGISYHVGMAAIFGILLHEHATVRVDDEAALQRAFFQNNALVGFCFLAACLTDTVVLK